MRPQAPHPHPKTRQGSGGLKPFLPGRPFLGVKAAQGASAPHQPIPAPCPLGSGTHGAGDRQWGISPTPTPLNESPLSLFLLPHNYCHLRGFTLSILEINSFKSQKQERSTPARASHWERGRSRAEALGRGGSVPRLLLTLSAQSSEDSSWFLSRPGSTEGRAGHLQGGAAMGPTRSSSPLLTPPPSHPTTSNHHHGLVRQTLLGPSLPSTVRKEEAQWPRRVCLVVIGVQTVRMRTVIN